MVKSVEESLKNEKKNHYTMHSIHVMIFVLYFFLLLFSVKILGVNCFQITYIYTIDITAIVRGPR